MPMLDTAGWYPDKPPVDSDSLDYQIRLAWIDAQLSTQFGEPVADPVIASPAPGSGSPFAGVLPEQATWTNPHDPTKTASEAAIFVYYYPALVLYSVQSGFGLPITGAQFTPPPPIAPPPPPPPIYAANPVGVAIPGYPSRYHVAPNANPAITSYVDPSTGHKFWLNPNIVLGTNFADLTAIAAGVGS